MPSIRDRSAYANKTVLNTLVTTLLSMLSEVVHGNAKLLEHGGTIPRWSSTDN